MRKVQDVCSILQWQIYHTYKMVVARYLLHVADLKISYECQVYIMIIKPTFVSKITTRTQVSRQGILVTLGA